MEESVVDAHEVEGREVTRRRACTVDDLVSTGAGAIRGQAERATEGDVTTDRRLGGGVWSQNRARRTEDGGVSTRERQLTINRQAGGVERGTRGDRQRIGGIDVDRTRTGEGLTRSEGEASRSLRVKGARGTDSDRRRSVQRTKGREGERASVHIHRASERIRRVKGELARAHLGERARTRERVREDHVIAIGVDRARLGGRNRQAVGDIVAVTRGELQRGITREGQSRRGAERISTSDFEGALGELEATREGISGRQR